VTKRELYKIEVIIEATPEQAALAQEAIGRALCPDEDHEGYCPVPWTTGVQRVADLDDGERVSWQQVFDEDRQRASEAGEANA
jgi:hypothetical protein